MTIIVPTGAVASFTAMLLVSAVAAPARAQDASAWIKDDHSAVRLLAGSRSGGVLLGGIAFKLEPGWHTYWRNPGDSGVPPRFDFTKSENIEAGAGFWAGPAEIFRRPRGGSRGVPKQGGVAA